MEAKTYCIFILLTSFFEMWSAGTTCKDAGDDCEKELMWAVFCGIISILVCIIMLVCYTAAKDCAVKAQPFIAGFLALLWFCGVAVCTFKAPFSTACAASGDGAANGFFATWLSFIFSAKMAAASISQIQAAADKGASASDDGKLLGGIALAGLVVLVQAAYLCDNSVAGYGSPGTGCRGVEWWAIMLGAIAFILSMVMIFAASAVQAFKKYLAILMALLWIFGVITLTFAYKSTMQGDNDLGIYGSLSNGFVATWAGTFLSCMFAYTSWAGDGQFTMEDLSDPKLYVYIIFVASFFEFWAAATMCDIRGSDNCTDEYAWAVACGFIGSCVCLVVIIMQFISSCADMVGKAQPFVAGFLFLLWLCGLLVMTFKLPFQSACGAANGYISTWLAFLFSMLYFMQVPQVQSLAARAASVGGSGDDGPYLSGLGLASLIVMAQGAYNCDLAGGCLDLDAWAVALGILSFVLCVVVIFVGAVSQFKKWIYLLLCALWFCGIATLTMKYDNLGAGTGNGTFASAGNGFFASWYCFLVAVALCYVEFVGGAMSDLFGGAAADGDAGASDGGVGVTAENTKTEANPTAVIPDDAAATDAPDATAEDAGDAEAAPDAE